MNEHLSNAVRLLLRHADEDLQLANLIFKHSASQAGRFAYMAAYHAAQAVITHLENIAPKTHNGVQSNFARLSNSHKELGGDLGRFYLALMK
jgi:uncharacterized protein (UPF0332 family)